MSDARHFLDLGRNMFTDRRASRAVTGPPAPAHNAMVLTGCLAAGPDESTFKLTNAAPNAQASISQPQPAGTSGERVEYELRPEKNLDTTGVAPVELKRFVGRQVEITARAGDEPATSAPPAAAGGAKVDPVESGPHWRTGRRACIVELTGSCGASTLSFPCSSCWRALPPPGTSRFFS
jgi:hypothetical protein